MLPSAPGYYAVQYQAQPALLRGRVLRPLSATEFTEVSELLLAWARHYDCPFWLLDGTIDTKPQPLDVYEWLRDEFFPRVHRSLGRIPCVAFIAQPDMWLALKAFSYAPPAPVVLSAAYRANWFTNEAEALAWLAHFRPAIGGG
ncbi:hypothetical protein GCM10023172_04120 [Hymenobacter ginsengisoli]|uniref:STAS/SEC14 domain-containing protein n=1 Tax=Hymenobacter ginsengisoli TaxID=1051626 RepID=A0ABP8Q0F2_9BACT|nr:MULTISPECIES: hypothetical protein [unclassified Hymenobacter]MBO2030513.1 hypothetical protein [Hymenobacter sp. BT559]